MPQSSLVEMEAGQWLCAEAHGCLPCVLSGMVGDRLPFQLQGQLLRHSPEHLSSEVGGRAEPESVLTS